MSGAAVAAMVRKARREIVQYLTDAGATAPEHAVPFDPDSLGWPRTRIRRRMWRRMRDFGAIREPRPGLFYLDEQQLDAFRWSIRRRVLGIMAAATAVAAAAVALGS